MLPPGDGFRTSWHKDDTVRRLDGMPDEYRETDMISNRKKP
jgi:hypothetical protein